MEYVWKDRKRTIFGLPLSFTRYKLTKERLFIETGFFSTVEDEIRLYRILDLRLSRSFRQKIFGIGDIHVSSSDKNQGDFIIKNVKKSKEIKEMISTYVEEQRTLKKITGREVMGNYDQYDEDGVDYEDVDE